MTVNAEILVLLWAIFLAVFFFGIAAKRFLISKDDLFYGFLMAAFPVAVLVALTGELLKNADF